MSDVMSGDAVAVALEGRFRDRVDAGVGAEWFESVISQGREFIEQYAGQISRESLLQGVGLALDRVFAGINTPGPDMIVEPAMKMAILAIIGSVYDSVKGGA